MNEVSGVQRLWLELIKLSSFNYFDGERVVKDLLANRGLWISVMMLPAGSEHGLILRDLPEGHHNVSTLYILTYNEDAEALEMLSGPWQADKVKWVRGEELEEFLHAHTTQIRKNVAMLSMWWD